MCMKEYFLDADYLCVSPPLIHPSVAIISCCCCAQRLPKYAQLKILPYVTEESSLAQAALKAMQVMSNARQP